MSKNKTFKSMQNENAVLKQDYKSLMQDFVEACKSERESNDMVRMFVGKYLMPQLRELETNVRPQSDNSLCAELETNVRPQSDNSLCTESGSFWYTNYKEACARITKLLQENDFAMGDLKAEIEFRQKAEAENLVLKGKIDVLENDLETAKTQVEIHEKMSKALYDNLEKDYAKIEMQKRNLKKEHVSDNSEDYFIVYERTKLGEMSSIGGFTEIEEAEELAKNYHEIDADKSHYVFKKVLILTPETNKK